MMNFQTPFWPGAQGIQDLPKQIEQLTQSFNRFLQDQMPREGVAPASVAASRLPQIDKMQPLVTELMSAHKALWDQMLQQRTAEPAEPVVAEVKRDRRFSSAAWTSSPVYDYMRQAYVLNSRFLNGLADVLPAENAKEASRLKFLTSQFIDALSPSNFAATNPEVIQKALATDGKSITEGINNLLKDLTKGRISTSDESAIEVGKNLATTEGAVVYENDLIQLIQYMPLTA